MPLNGKLEASTLYLSLNSRPKKGEYHYGIVATDANAQATLYHASNLGGHWRMESKTSRPESSMSLVVLVKIDAVRKNNLPAVVKSIPADGAPSKRTREAFDCLTWVKDALVALDANGIIRLPANVDDIVSEAKKQGSKYASRAERGGGATVIN
ncbi:hypothetical protein M434DRAFT_397897 [Hypoxylon sp. CO27-5]|nr:hypothetical protein M434DRAFT_397897 [Hypoxylon sp. CO27-5]